jgi:urea carboxylase-associated protein 2
MEPGVTPILDSVLPGGASLARTVRRGTQLTLTDVAGGGNVSALLYRADAPLERYCMPDTLKAQHVSRITAGTALYSDMGRVMASVVRDTCGWHDTICGHLTAPMVQARYGYAGYQEHRNGWRRSAREAFLVELAKHGLGARDLVGNLNLFSKVQPAADGTLTFVPGASAPGSVVTLRFELDVLLVLVNVPHPLDPSTDWAPGEVGLLLEDAAPVTADDPVRLACPENERGFAATAELHA